MIAVTHAALGPAVPLERDFVRAAVEQHSVTRVARTADLRDARDLGRHRGMVAVTVVACRRADVAAFEQRLAVYAHAVLLELIRRKRRTVWSTVSGHANGIRVTSTTGFGHSL